MDNFNRFGAIIDILKENGLSDSFRNYSFFDELLNTDLKSSELVNQVVQKIKDYDKYLEENNCRYPENIMHIMRETLELSQFDVSEDETINEMTPDDVFDSVCKHEGLLGSYSRTIKSWVTDIYKVELGR